MSGGDKQLTGFVREALTKGHSRSEISVALEQAGWQKDQIGRALNAFAEVDFPIPVPRSHQTFSARDAAFYLFMFIALYVSVFTLAELLFTYINIAFPDGTTPYQQQNYDRHIRGALARLVIFFPAFAFMFYRDSRAQEKAGDVVPSAVRQWLVYLTVLVAAVVFLSDLTTFVYQFLMGGLSMRFCLKVLVVALLAGLVLGYYLKEARRSDAAAEA